jgi:DNA replication and repair protein RecF
VAYLSRLNLINFRVFSQLDLDLPLGVVVLSGGNATGKTTLLEAAYLLAIARSFRAENEREVISFEAGANGEQALVAGVVETKNRRLSVNVGYQSVVSLSAGTPDPRIPGQRDGLGYSVQKQIRVDRQRCTAADLVGMVGAALFNAADVDLVYGAPSVRRRYLDILISQADTRYIKSLQRCQRVVKQRNQLLKMVRDGRAGCGEMEFWDQELVREGAWITWRRHQVIQRLSDLGAEHHGQLADGGSGLLLEYRPSVAGGGDLADTETRFEESLAAFRQRELATGATVVGPHRDDFRLLVNNLDMGSFASRGEARTLALALRLAEASYLWEARGDEPVLLLDDVLSEMDAGRRQRVLRKLTQYQQVLITTTDPQVMREHLGNGASYFTVAAGQCQPEPVADSDS